MLALFTALAGPIVHRDDEDGQGLAEYALILALIAIVAIVALIFLGGQISDKLSVVGDGALATSRHSFGSPPGPPAGFPIPGGPPASLTAANWPLQRTLRYTGNLPISSQGS